MSNRILVTTRTVPPVVVDALKQFGDAQAFTGTPEQLAGATRELLPTSRTTAEPGGQSGLMSSTVGC